LLHNWTSPGGVAREAVEWPRCWPNHGFAIHALSPKKNQEKVMKSRGSNCEVPQGLKIKIQFSSILGGDSLKGTLSIFLMVHEMNLIFNIISIPNF